MWEEVLLFFAINENITAAVVNIQGRTFMQTIDCPFRGIDHAFEPNIR
jgi:calcineurin-like phosphoesterase